MSGYAIAYVAATHGVPCHIVKVVTGHFHSQNKNFRKTRTSACQTMADFSRKEIQTLQEIGMDEPKYPYPIVIARL